ncbi:MAG: hypothetical protein JNL41_14880 [Phenylobacterium sp.]|uniref:hypothetical protein n=1 Tax=Phenylobacterium sp. TaxID=1871053 RepID=UPI001A600C96|nr:hypothetical protein [Phenylobacterium sp.]MBL8555557.1 hypothetical protein [Phenylobacterium sp.]
MALIWPDLGINMMADSLALWFGVFVVDQAISAEQEAHGAPIRRLMLREATSIQRRLSHLLTMSLHRVSGGREEMLERFRKGELPIGALLLNGLEMQADSSYRTFDAQGEARIVTWSKIYINLGGALHTETDVFITRYITVASVDLMAAMLQLGRAELMRSFQKDSILRFTKKVSPKLWMELLRAERDLSTAIRAAIAADGLEAEAEAEQLRPEIVGGTWALDSLAEVAARKDAPDDYLMRL